MLLSFQKMENKFGYLRRGLNPGMKRGGLLQLLMMVINGDFITMAQRRRGVWIPVRLNRIWQSSPESQLLFHMAREILKRLKQFVGLIIAGILGLIGVIAAAAIDCF
nr:endogenous retrovirus group K member 13-1 Env polyprotein-like isoform X2 [Dasypus novemcinctus]